MNHLDVVGTEGCKVEVETITPKIVLDNAASRMLRSIQDGLGFSAAEDAILQWLEGCTIDGVERLAIALDDYLQNRRQAESTDDLQP